MQPEEIKALFQAERKQQTSPVEMANTDLISRVRSFFAHLFDPGVNASLDDRADRE
jgi:hypothetical protein